MSKLYIDVTELAGWQGKLTGVPRVMDELVRRFALDSDTYFIKWQPQGYTLIEYPFSVEENQVNKQSKIIQLGKAAYGRSRVVKKAVYTSRKLASVKKKSLTQNYISLSESDVLLVLADWHGGDPSFREYLKNIKKRGVNIAQIVYDMLPIVTPQYSGHSTEMLSVYSREIYPICDLIFSISEHTKNDIKNWLKKNKLHVPEVKVFRLGDDFSRSKATKPSEYTIPRKFILCVGTIEARKNHTLLYYTYKLAAKQNIDLPPVVIVGRVGWLATDTYEIMKQDPEINQKFIFMHNVSDEELSWLFNNCLFSVYPSFYEGWGLPIAESIAHGKPVIASNTSSMPEIAGDLINYFSPSSPEECMQRIIELLDEKNLDIATKRIGQYKPVSWNESFNTINNATRGLL